MRYGRFGGPISVWVINYVCVATWKSEVWLTSCFLVQSLSVFFILKVAGPTGGQIRWPHLRSDWRPRWANEIPFKWGVLMRYHLNEVCMRRQKWDAHGQVKMRCARASQSEVRMCRPKKDAHAQAKMKLAWSSVNEMRMRRSKWDVHVQAKMRCAWAGQN